jgi:hypothetical protein
MKGRYVRAIIAAVFLIARVNAVAAEKQTSPIVFFHEEADVKQLAELKRLYGFDEYVAKGRDEFERMNLLKRWTFDTITYGGAKKYTELRNSLTIIEKAKNGEVFWCNNIAAVYMQCALSLGWTARYVIMRNDKGEGHLSNDIWSNQYRKWVMIDATWNVHVEKDGIPLSFVEVRDEWLKNGGADVVYVFGAGDGEKRYTRAMLPITHSSNFLYKYWPVTKDWISLTYEMGFVGRNNFFTNVDDSGAYIWDTIYTVKPPSLPDDKTWDLNRYPSPPLGDLFRELNCLELRAEPAKGVRGGYVLTMDAFSNGNYTPNFETYEYRIDEGKWTDAKSGVVVKPGRGKNRIEARVRNKFGVNGPPSFVDVK